MLLPPRIGSALPAVAALLAVGGSAAAQPNGFCCRDPQPPHRLQLCSPLQSILTTRIVTEGVEISFDAPPRDATSLVTPVTPVDSVSWGGHPADQPVPGIVVTGSYLGQRDQSIEVAILQINADSDSGVVGTDMIRVAWSSVFRAQARAEFVLNPSDADRPLQFAIPGPAGSRPDTSVVPGLRITFQRGTQVRREWRAIFGVEDFEGFHVWRWASDPNVEPRVVGTYGKLANAPRPLNAWPGAQPTSRRYTFLDGFVIDGNVYHYAVTTYDQGFDTIRGGTLGALPFDSPLPAEGCDSQLRFEFLRPPPQTFQSVQAVPNPYRQVNCDRSDPLSTCTVRFIRMPTRGTLFIFTMAGDLVREFHHPEDAASGDVPGTLRWDTANQSGNEVASGVYIYKIVDLESGRESFGRLAIIR